MRDETAIEYLIRRKKLRSSRLRSSNSALIDVDDESDKENDGVDKRPHLHRKRFENKFDGKFSYLEIRKSESITRLKRVLGMSYVSWLIPIVVIETRSEISGSSNIVLGNICTCYKLICGRTSSRENYAYQLV